MITLPSPPRHVSLVARLYLLLGGFPGVYAAFTLLATALLGSFIALNLNPADLFYAVEPTAFSGTVTKVATADAEISGQKVHVVSFTWSDANGQGQSGTCYALNPPQPGDVLPLEVCHEAYRLQGTTFGEFGSLSLGLFLFFLSLGFMLALSAFCALFFRLAFGIRTIRLLRTAPIIYAHEFRRKETGIRVNEQTEECLYFRLTFPNASESEIALKTCLGASLSPAEPQAILAESPKNVQLLANLLETLKLKPNGSFTLNGASLLSVLMVFVFLGFALAFPAAVLFMLR